MEKKKNIVIFVLSIVIVILSVVVVLFATNAISFNDNSNDDVVDRDNNDNQSVNDSNNNVVDENNEDNSDKVIYYGLENKDWIDYLRKKNVVVKMSAYNYEKEECEYNNISLSSDQIVKILDELSLAKITKSYYGYYPGGWACPGNFKLEYEGINVEFDSSGNMRVYDDILSNKIDLDLDYVEYRFGAEENNYAYFYRLDIKFKDIVDKYRPRMSE